MINPINITSDMLPEQIIEVAHKSTAVPSLAIGFLVFMIVSFLPYFTYSHSAGKSKYLLSWVFFVIVTGVIFLFIAGMPLQVNEIVSFIKNFLS